MEVRLSLIFERVCINCDLVLLVPPEHVDLTLVKSGYMFWGFILEKYNAVEAVSFTLEREKYTHAVERIFADYALEAGKIVRTVPSVYMLEEEDQIGYTQAELYISFVFKQTLVGSIVSMHPLSSSGELTVWMGMMS